MSLHTTMTDGLPDSRLSIVETDPVSSDRVVGENVARKATSAPSALHKAVYRSDFRSSILSELSSASIVAYQIDVEAENEYMCQPVPITILSSLQLLGRGTSFTARLIPSIPPDYNGTLSGNIASSLTIKDVTGRPTPQNRPCVVKTLRIPASNLQEKIAHTQNLIRSVVRELRVLSHIPFRRHNNILHLLGLFWSVAEDGFAWPALLVEFAPFGTLAILRNKTEISYEEGHNICLDVANGVAALHGCNVVHGDIKSENVLICQHQTRKYQAKVADFGSCIIRPVDPYAMVSSNGSTELWRAPEYENVASFAHYQCADLFSLGLLLWQTMLTQSSSPFSACTEFIHEVCREDGIDPFEGMFSTHSDKPRSVAEVNMFMKNVFRGVFQNGLMILTSRRSIHHFKRSRHLMPAIKHSFEFGGGPERKIGGAEEGQAFLPILQTLLHVDPSKRDLSQAISLLETLCNRKPVEFQPKPLVIDHDRMPGLLGSLLHFLNYEVVLELPALVRHQQISQTLSHEADAAIAMLTTDRTQVPQGSKTQDSLGDMLQIDSINSDVLTACRIVWEGFGRLEFLPPASSDPAMIIDSIRASLTFGTPMLGPSEWSLHPRASMNLVIAIMNRYVRPGCERAMRFLATILPSVDPEYYGSHDDEAIEPSELETAFEREFYTPGPAWRKQGVAWETFKHRKAQHLLSWSYFYGSLHGSYTGMIQRTLEQHESELSNDSWSTELRAERELMATNYPVHFYSTNPTSIHDLQDALSSHPEHINLSDRYGCAPLLVACKYGNPAAVKLLIEYGADASITNAEKESGFHYLCSMPPDEVYSVAKDLATAGANPSACCTGRAEYVDAPRWIQMWLYPTATTPLHRAVTFGDVPTAKALLAVGADPNVEDPLHVTAVELAISLNCSEIIEEMIRTNKIDLSHWYSLYGNNAVFCALRANYNFCRMMIHRQHYFDQQIRTLQLLEENGSDWGKICKGKSFNALQWAVKRSSTNIVTYLLTRESLGLTRYLNSDSSLAPPLLLAISDVNINMVVLLLELGADVHVVHQDYSALHFLAKTAVPATDLAEVLIYKGAPMDVKDNKSLTAFDLAVIHRNFSIATLLVKHGAAAVSSGPEDINLLGRLAWRHDNVEAGFRYLLNPDHNGAVPSFIVNPQNGTSIFHEILTSNKDHTTQRKLILVALEYFHSAAHVNHADNAGFTPLMAAVRMMNLEAAELLLDAGADIDIELTPGRTVRNSGVLDDLPERARSTAWEMDDFIKKLQDRPRMQRCENKPFTERESMISRRQSFFKLLFNAKIPVSSGDFEQKTTLKPSSQNDIERCIITDTSFAEAMVLCDPELSHAGLTPSLLACVILRCEPSPPRLAFLLDQEYLDGLPLQQFLLSNSGTDLNRKLQLCVKLVEALTQIHERGFTHGCLNPKNIQIIEDSHGTLRVLIVNFEYAAAQVGNPRSLKLHSNILAYEAPETGSVKRDFGWTFEELILCENFALGVVMLFVFRNGQTSLEYPIHEEPRAFEHEIECIRATHSSEQEAITSHVVDVIRTLTQIDVNKRPLELDDTLGRLLSLLPDNETDGVEVSRSCEDDATSAERTPNVL